MLPSKGYFKSLDCPCFEIGFCDRPYCVFRHNPSYIQCVTLDNEIDVERLLFGEAKEENLFYHQQETLIQNIGYKPTPISELDKLPMRNNSYADETYFDQTFEEMIISDPQLNENTTKFESKKETNAPENETVNNVLSNNLKGKESEQATEDVFVHSTMNESSCFKSDEKITKEDQTNCEVSDNVKSYSITNTAPKAHEKQKKKKSSKIKILSLSKSDVKRKSKEKYSSNFKISKVNSKDDKILKQRDIVITRQERGTNTEKEGFNKETSEEKQEIYIKCEENASKIKSSLKPKVFSKGDKEVSNEYIVISSEDETFSYSNKQTNKRLSSKKLKKDYAGKTYNKVTNGNTASLVSTNSFVSASKVANIKTKLSLNSTDSNTNIKDDESTLDNRVERKRKARISMGTVWREQKIRKHIEMMTPARRLLEVANQKNRERTENIALLQKSTMVKIRSVPNVKLLLQEKEKLLRIIANKNSNSNRGLKH